MSALATLPTVGVPHGLAAGGEAGMARVLSISRTEIERDMGLMGRTRIADITAEDVDHVSRFRSKPRLMRGPPSREESSRDTLGRN